MIKELITENLERDGQVYLIDVLNQLNGDIFFAMGSRGAGPTASNARAIIRFILEKDPEALEGIAADAGGFLAEAEMGGIEQLALEASGADIFDVETGEATSLLVGL